MKTYRFSPILVALFLSGSPALHAQAKPVFDKGEAQIVPAFKDSSTWEQHDLLVETEFDTDGDGKKDRMHVDVTRPGQTETEGLKLPVVYASSPYYAGTAGNVAKGGHGKRGGIGKNKTLAAQVH